MARAQHSVPPHGDVMRHHRAAWRVERAGWVVMGLLIVAALVGVLGDGPVSRTRAGDASGLMVEYDRLQRSSAPTVYRFQVAPSLARDGTLRLRFDQALVERIELESTVPEPEHVRAGPGYTEFEFHVAPGNAPAHIAFHFRPATFGRSRGRVAAQGAPPLVLDQFVYP